MILIHPPVAKPSEPPAGIARLSSCLKANGVKHQVIDGNLEGMLYLAGTTARAGLPSGRWNSRACKNLETNLAALQNIMTFSNKSRYSRAVLDVNRVLFLAGIPGGAILSLSDYADSRLSPVKSSDLIRAAENPETNPFYAYFSGRLAQALEETPEFIGFSLNFLSQAICTMAMIGFIKKINPRQKIILGGSLTTSWFQITGRPNLFTGLVDEIVAGAGEEKLLELLGIKDIRSGSSTDYHLLMENRYLSPGFILPYSAARGCWWRKCAFCPEKAEANPYLPLPSAHAAEELQTLSNLTHPSLIHLLDSSIAPSLLKALAQQPPGAPWYGFVRITPHLADEDFCRVLKRSGCVMLKLGIESGDQDVLDSLNKGIDLQTVSAALRMLRKTGIATYCYFLFGTPPETETAAMKTLDFVSRHAGCIDFLNLAIFNLPAASAEAQIFATRDFYEGDLSLYRSFHHPGGWQRPNVRNYLAKTFKKHPAIAPIIERTPEFFTSNHAPFFTF
ncbi:MAG: radical SAM protein [Deltaproteobacteria bacterium HGW-Deltaproteobacteria-6]|nr:MAG: radical SAM protein [Deltaproteobacteria bacterium HGW-Deltaproteobacteria-6]